MNKSRFFLTACFLVLSGICQVGASEWYSWRGPWQTGASPEKDLPASWSPDPKAKDNNLVWKAPYGCRSTPLVMNGRVYLINYTSCTTRIAGNHSGTRHVPGCRHRQVQVGTQFQRLPHRHRHLASRLDQPGRRSDDRQRLRSRHPGALLLLQQGRQGSLVALADGGVWPDVGLRRPGDVAHRR